MGGDDPKGQGSVDGLKLLERFDAHLRSSGLLAPGDAITVALSGGLDSVTLLDLLLALRDRWGWHVSAAHFDHRMREASGSEAAWVQDLCDRLAVSYWLGRADAIPRNEAEARELRYAFLDKARAALGARCLATAHQADDQAETVLFRMLRGSGLAGLAGIPARRAPGIVRPLLPFWRSEVQAYAGARGLTHLEDPSNLDLGIRRNRIRHRLIPEIEASGAPGVRRDLCRLSELAGRAARTVEGMVDDAASALIVEATESRMVVARTALLSYDTLARAHLLRALVARLGPRPGRIGTRIALKFIDTSSSGRAIHLAGGIVIRREFDRFIIERPGLCASVRDEECVVQRPQAGGGEVTIAGRRWLVSYEVGRAPGRAPPVDGSACFDLAELVFPLVVRGWQPGDRIRTHAGSRKLKRVFADGKVGCSERARFPVLADRSGVLWIVGLLQGARASAAESGEVFSIRFERMA
jgi:tRNA(Ile)-lysidine synthase